MGNPRDRVAINEVERWTGKKVIPVFTNGEQLADVVEYYYSEKKIKKDIESLAKLTGDIDYETLSNEEMNILASGTTSSPTVKLINMLFETAAIYRASDIHIKPNENFVRIRMRIDGELREIANPPISSLSAIISRIKVMSELNIAEKRKPQDGACTYKTDKYFLEFRVSILPSLYGESCVMRVIDKKQKEYDFASLGLSESDEKTLKHMINRKDGLVLVTGPTGSGKTTTLYTSLRHLNKPNINIITCEDPVESPIEGINQIQINAAVGLDFAAALRSILRHDPDIILIGEIRDTETAQIAVRSSITGHLVLSTLHTNDAISAIMRLNDMGVDRFLIASSLAGRVAQRLLKRVCPHCCEDHPLSKEEAEIIGLPEGTITKIGKGCVSCGNTGNSGRVAIYELVKVTREIREMISNGSTVDEITELAVEQGMVTLKDSCRAALLSGITSYKEAIKIIFAND
jgi:type IV pilus assembly protein PilB